MTSNIQYLAMFMPFLERLTYLLAWERWLWWSLQIPAVTPPPSETVACEVARGCLGQKNSSCFSAFSFPTTCREEKKGGISKTWSPECTILDVIAHEWMLVAILYVTNWCWQWLNWTNDLLTCLTTQTLRYWYSTNLQQYASGNKFVSWGWSLHQFVA